MSATESRTRAVAEGTPALRWTGAIAELSADDRRQIFERSTSADETIRSRTASILARVHREGDAALFALARELDGVELATLEVPRRAWDTALDRIPRDVRRAMERTIRNVASVHRAFLPTAFETEPEPGITIGRRPDPLGRVGVYAPGGRAAYPSSVLMGAVPARVAGVNEVIVCSPPGRDGLPTDVVLAAARLAEADRVFALGGAGAIGAMAYGTTAVPRVDRIVGPGNAYVAEAKLQVAGAVAIDSPAGPSELLVIGDASSDAETIARELLAQGEHDPRACVVAAVVGERVAHAVTDALARQIGEQPRRAITEQALAGQSAVVWAETIDDVVTFANEYAPEHLLLATTSAEVLLPRMRNAGTIFVGDRASVAFGDYMTGANHVLPTGGLARSYSGLSVLDFIRWTTYQRVSAAAAASLAADVGIFADAEALPGHAISARAWAENTAGRAR